MGHTVDPLHYDKIYTLDPEWVKNEYRKALPYLNIISGGVDVDREKKLWDEIEALKQELQALRETTEKPE